MTVAVAARSDLLPFDAGECILQSSDEVGVSRTTIIDRSVGRYFSARGALAPYDVSTREIVRVWTYICTTYLIFSLLLFLFAMLSTKENPLHSRRHYEWKIRQFLSGWGEFFCRNK